MANNKKHHFVPQFYLKIFSPDGKSISLFNKRTSKTVVSTGIKTQCYRDYFYGKDLTLEKSLGQLEGSTANIFRIMISSTSIPQRKDEMYNQLLHYVAIQISRTTYASDEISQIRNLTSKYGYLKPIKGSECPQTAIKYSIPLLSAFYSLSTKLVINHTKEKFITSDNPCPFYNVLTEKLNIYGGSHINSLGLKIFFPISPDLMIIFYDEGIYKLGDKKSNLIQLNYLSDAVELNKLQLVSSEQNVYFKDSIFDASKLHQAAKKFYRVQKLEPVNTSQDLSINAERVDIRTNLKLSFLTLKKKARLLLKSPDSTIFNQGRDKTLKDELILIHMKFFNGVISESQRDNEFLDLARMRSIQMQGKG